MSWYHSKTFLDKFFEGGIIFKGINGALELIGGFLLFFTSPTTLHQFLVAITQKELIEDPRDLISNALLHSSTHFSNGGKIFLIAYLWIHGIIKLIAVIGILRNYLWAYPFSLITLGLFMLYQIYNIYLTPSIGLILLTILDIVILWLIWREYGKVRTQLGSNS